MDRVGGETGVRFAFKIHLPLKLTANAAYTHHPNEGFQGQEELFSAGQELRGSVWVPLTADLPLTYIRVT